MKYLIFPAIFATVLLSTAHADPLLKLEQYSGYTQPQYAMEAHCSLDQGHLISKILKDHSNGTWGQEASTDVIVSDLDLTQIQTWIAEAALGPFQQGTNPCDVGTVKIVTQNYPLVYSQDCGKKIINLHPSATKLVAWFRQACSLEGNN